MLHILEAIGGGTAKHLIDVCRTVPARHTVVVPEERIGALTDPTALASLRGAGADVHIVPMRRAVASTVNAKAILRIRSIIKTLRPDVVHGHASVGGAIARIATRGTGIPAVYTPHAVVTSRLALPIERQLARYTAAAIAVSPSEGRLMKQLGLANDVQLKVIPNGVEPRPGIAPFSLRKRIGVSSTTPLVACIARLVDQKAPLDLVRAAGVLHGLVPDAHVVLIGDGPLADDVDAEIAALGLTDVFHRLSVASGAGDLLAEADVVALTSRYEGLPYTILEAFRAGTPMVATACVGSVDTIVHGKTGLLAEPGDIAGIAACLAEILTSADRGAALAAGATADLDRRFSVHAMAASLYLTYSDVVGRTLGVPAEVPATADVDLALL